jgi:hypothetical protein
MDKELLKAIAESVLTQLVGEGRWYKQKDRPRFEKIDNPVMGLEVGDVVFTYDEDEEEMQERQVIAIVNGIGYVLWASSYHGPLLLAVSDDCYGKTAKEAAEANREQIESDIEYAQRRYDRMTKVKAILGQ